MAYLEKQIFLVVNDGQGGKSWEQLDDNDTLLNGISFDLTPYVINIGSVQWEADKELTKISPGSLSVRIADHDEKLWKWLEKQVLSVNGALPPFIYYDVGSTRHFLGIVPLNQCERIRAQREVTIEAQDWSIMLSNIVLQGPDWERPWPKATTPIRPAETKICRINPDRTSKKVFGVTVSTEYDMSHGFFMDTKATDMANAPSLNNMNKSSMHFDEYPIGGWLVEGDVVRTQVMLNSKCILDKMYKISEIDHIRSALKITRRFSFAKNKEFRDDIGGAYDRHAPHPRYVYVTRDGSNYAGMRGYKIVKPAAKAAEEGKPKNYNLYLNTVDGLVMGDVLELASTDKKTFTVMQIDVIKNLIVCKEEVADLFIDSMVYLDEASRSQLVFMDARTLVYKAVEPFSANIKRWSPAILPSPAFCWLPLRPFEGADLMPVSDLEASTKELKVFSGPDRVWYGNPQDGWRFNLPNNDGSLITKYGPWTNQLAHSPKHLLPMKGLTANNLSLPELEEWIPGPDGEYIPVKTSSGNIVNVARDNCLYDYIAMRRIYFNSTTLRWQNYVEQDSGLWGYTEELSQQWPGPQVMWAGASEAVIVGPSTLCVLPGAPGFLVGCYKGLNFITIAQIPGTIYDTVLLPGNIRNAKDYHLQTTPWGVYLVTENSYSRVIVHWNNVVSVRNIITGEIVNSPKTIKGIEFVTAVLTDGKNGVLYPNTFVGVNENTVAVFGRFTEYTAIAIDELKTETHLLLLKAFPVPAIVPDNPNESVEVTEHPSVISNDKIIDGEAITLGCLRDPSPNALNRVVGHCGGQLFQIACELPWTIERFEPGEMSAMELIEHICQIQLAFAYPDTEGTIQIVSRHAYEPATLLNIADISVSTSETLVWEEHASYVIVSGANDDACGDADGIPGGTTMEISGHPMIHSATMAKAVAQAYVQVFGSPRRKRTQDFFWSDTSSAAPWLLLNPLPTIAIGGANGIEKKAWLITGIDHDEHTGQATLTMVESLEPLYGQSL